MAMAAAGIDVNSRGDMGINLLQWALRHGSPEGMNALLEAGADASLADVDGMTVLHLASQVDDPQYLGVLMARRIDVDLANTVTGETPLFEAIMHDREEQFLELMAAGADVDATDNLGNTPLHAAAKVNDARRALALLEAGSDPYAVNREGVTFQHYFALMGDTVRSERARDEKRRLEAWMSRAEVASILVEPKARAVKP